MVVSLISRAQLLFFLCTAVSREHGGTTGSPPDNPAYSYTEVRDIRATLICLNVKRGGEVLEELLNESLCC